ncbi:MAG: amino acid ABC transporter substrate-binding protein [SAR324 cluster bacterium]|nr:amino acid ABC transporter substrate-binding protein [SAR324 cluster bacterium]MCZ6645698.1 amino acid ABC transporter substrate-binding protein [SAR324 cluster bacterium]
MQVLITVLAVAGMLLPGTAWAEHRGDDTVLVGGALARTGRYAEPAGRFYNSITMYVDQLNARGGLLGHKVVLRLLDDKSDKQTSIKLFEKLITSDKVDIILGPYSSGITDAVANVTERYKMPFIAHGAASSVIWQRGRKYIFNIIDIAENYQKGAMHLAKEIGVKRIAIIGEDSLFPRMSRKGAEMWAKRLGIEVVLAENYATRKQGDYTALLQKAKSRRAQAIFSNSYFADASAQIRQMRELGINMMMFASTVGPGLPRFAKDLGPTAEYVLGFSQWEPVMALGHPGMGKFIADYKARYGGKPNYHAGQTWAMMQVVESTVIKTGSFDNVKMRDTFATIKVRTIIGTYKVNDIGINNHDGLTFQIQDGQRVIIWPPRLAQAKPRLPMPKWSDR